MRNKFLEVKEMQVKFLCINTKKTFELSSITDDCGTNATSFGGTLAF